MSPPLAADSPVVEYAALFFRRRRTASVSFALTLLVCAAVAVAQGKKATVRATILEMSFDRAMTSLDSAPQISSGLAATLGAKTKNPIRAILATRELRLRTARALSSTANLEVADPLRTAGYKLDVGEGEGGSITISIESRTAESAAAANAALLDQLASLLNEKAITATRRERERTEKLLLENSARKRELEEALMGFGADGSVSMDPEVESLLAKVSMLRERAAARRIEADALAGATNDAGATHGFLEDASALQAEAAQLAAKVVLNKSGTMIVPVARVPLLALQLRRLQGELRILDQISAVLTQQRETALIQEAREAPTFTIIDPPAAVAADIRPQLRQVILLSILAALFTGAGSVFFTDWAITHLPHVAKRLDAESPAPTAG